MRELLIEGAEALSKAASPYGWQSLQRSQAFVTVAQEEQTNTPIPTDFRRFVPDSFFNRDQKRPLIGPLTPQQWQLQQVWPLVGFFLLWREREGKYLITPPPLAGQIIAYEYISSYWAKSSAGVAKATFTSDDDGTYLDEELLKLDLRWRWKEAKGLDYGEDMATFERERSLALGDDGGSTSLNQGGPRQAYPWQRANVPEGSWGV
jgi:hypothetical protein